MAIVQVKKDLGKFSVVELMGYGDVFVEQVSDPAAPGRLVIEADDSIASRVGGEVAGNRLRLGMIMPWYEWFSFWWTWLFAPKKIVYRVTAPRIEGLEISGSGSITAAELRVERCTLVVRGSGKILFHGSAARELSSIITGSGLIECRGSAPTHEVRVSGSGDVRASALETARTTVRIMGSGSVAVSVKDSLDVGITGSGSVRYSGEPKLQTRITGSGRVKQEKTR
jgi:hypothetical protein